jgi:hypothetical protein
MRVEQDGDVAHQWRHGYCNAGGVVWTGRHGRMESSSNLMASRGVFKGRSRHIGCHTLGGRGNRMRISGEECGGGKEKGGKILLKRRHYMWQSL